MGGERDRGYPIRMSVVDRTRARAAEWADSREAGSLQAVAVGAWHRYRAADGPLQSALLSLYMLIAVLPALIVMEEYLDANPAALSDHIVRHYDLSPATAAVLHSVLVQSRAHELGSALLAIASALFFGLGFGRVLQLVHVRVWRLPLPQRAVDQARYGLVLLGLYGLILLLLVQLTELTGAATWTLPLLALGWTALVALFFGWAARLLTHGLLAWRDVLPGAAFTALALTILVVVSRWVMELWVNLYARDYGGLGVVMAIYFWIAIASGIVVAAATISPELSAARAARRARPR